MFNTRDENAIKETDKKYRNYCYSISYNILGNKEDAEECLNDTYFSVWDTIPPHSPVIFSAYVAKITRFISLKKLREKNTSKRGGGNVFVAFDELSECIADKKLIETELETKELGKIVNQFVEQLSALEQKIFICRYWYFDSIISISHQFGFSESKVKSILHRIRKKLKTKLEKEGISIET